MNVNLDTGFLPQDTRNVFEILSNQNFIGKYTLVGGTALALQIKHRISEDLDFLFDGEALNIPSIERNIKSIFPQYRVIRIEKDEQIDLLLQGIKVSFFCSGMIQIPFKVTDYARLKNKMLICRAEIIASLKMMAIAHRNTIRDYYDLYMLAKYHIPLEEIINQTKKIIPNLSPVTYTETLVYTDDIAENEIRSHLNPAEQVTKYQIAAFFSTELKKIIDRL